MDVLLEQPPWLLAGGAVLLLVIIQSLFQPAKVKEQPDVSTKAAAPSSTPPPTSSAAAKKKRKKSKKKAAPKQEQKPEPEPEPEPVVVKEPPASKSKKKNKKKNKNKKPEPAPSPAPATPKVEEKPPAEVTADEDDDDEDDDDVARLLNANQLSKTTKKKKKKKKKKGSAAGGNEADEQKEDENWVMVNKQHGGSANAALASESAAATSATDAVHTVTLNLAPSDKPVLVGPKGATIQNIQTTSGARLDIDLPVLKISGTESSIAMAMEMVQNLLSENEAKKAHTSTLSGTAINSSDGVKAIIGKGGATIQKIQAETGCKIDADVDGGKVVITGPTQDQVQSAATLCRNAVFGEHQDTINLGDKSKVMLVLGQNFQKIRQFQDESGGAKLDIAKNTTLLKISGPTAAVKKAKAMVNEWLAHCQGATIDIPKHTPGSFDKIGAIYGKGGATIRTIQDKTGAFIHVDDVAGKCRISGLPAAVAQAKGMVEQAMEDGNLMRDGDIRETIALPRKAGPSVIGRGGSNIKQLESNHQVKVRVSGSVCILIGEPASISRCKTEIIGIIQPFVEEERIQQEADRLAAEQDAAAAASSGTVQAVGTWSASLNDDEADGW